MYINDFSNNRVFVKAKVKQKKYHIEHHDNRFIKGAYYLFKNNFLNIILFIIVIFIWIPTCLPGGDNPLYLMVSTWIWLHCLLILERNAKKLYNYLFLFIALWISLAFNNFGTYGSTFIQFVLNLINCIIVFPAFLIDNLLNRKFNNFLMTLVFPILFLLFSFISLFFNIGTNLRIDIFQGILIVPYQIVSVIGAFGMSFLITWICTCIIYIFKNRKNYRKLIKAIICPIIIIFIWIFGFVRLKTIPKEDFSFNMAYAIGPYRGDFLEDYNISYEEQVEYFTSTCKKAAEEGAKLIVYTEESFYMLDNEYERFITLVKNMSKDNNIDILLGVEKDNYYSMDINEILWATSNGEIKIEYKKSRLIPVLESRDYEVGDNIIPYIDFPIDGHIVRISMCICFDGHNPLYTYSMNPETNVFILPAWEWDIIQEKARLSTTYIPVQNHVTFVKVVYDGYSFVTDPYGREIYIEKNNNFNNSYLKIINIPVYEKD